jgi:hypothetical protein
MEQAHPSVEQRAYSGQRFTGGPGAQAHFMLDTVTRMRHVVLNDHVILVALVVGKLSGIDALHPCAGH